MFLHEDTLHKGAFAHSSFYTQIFFCTDAFAHCKISRAKKCFYRQMCSFSEAPHTEAETMRGRKSCDGTGCVYFSRVCVFFPPEILRKDLTDLVRRSFAEVFPGDRAQSYILYIYRVLAKRPFPEIPAETDPSNPQTDPLPLNQILFLLFPWNLARIAVVFLLASSLYSHLFSQNGSGMFRHFFHRASTTPYTTIAEPGPEGSIYSSSSTI